MVGVRLVHLDKQSHTNACGAMGEVAAVVAAAVVTAVMAAVGSVVSTAAAAMALVDHSLRVW